MTKTETSKTVVSCGPSEFRDPHLVHRRAQERAHLAAVADDTDPIASLVTVELNTTELCNRKCVFCPRVDPEVYPNRDLHMAPEVAVKVAGDLAACGAPSRISISGFGEPLLHSDIAGLVRAVRAVLPANTIEMNTSGDRLSVAKIGELFAAGLTHLYVNMYDGPEQGARFERMFAEAGLDESAWRLRPHWPGADRDFGLTLNNRSGTVSSPGIGLGPIDAPLRMRCHYPFFKMLVDWNGDVPFCSNDWGREIVVGNVMETGLRELWLSQRLFEVRRRLAKGDRCFSPCDKCNVHGTWHGGASARRLIDHYVASGLMSRGEAEEAVEA